MSELSQALGMEQSVVWRGKTWKLGPVTTECIARWEMWLGELALEAMQKYGGRLGGQDKILGTLAQMEAAGDFDFFGETSVKRQQTPRGQAKLYYILISQHADQQDFTEADAKDLVEQQQMELYQKYVQMTTNPNDDAPAAETAPGASQSGEASSPPSSPTAESPSPKSAE